jgi:hypothetical protein
MDPILEKIIKDRREDKKYHDTRYPSHIKCERCSQCLGCFCTCPPKIIFRESRAWDKFVEWMRGN